MKLSLKSVLLSGLLFFALNANAFSRIVVFGDSLSDVGTYSKTTGRFGGGKFTTNPGDLWVEVVAKKFNLPMLPNRLEGLGDAIPVEGGFNYAQGGARIVLEPNIVLEAASQHSIATQIGFFLTENKKFQATDLVLMQGGGNDIIKLLEAVQRGRIKSDQAIESMIQAAEDFYTLISQVQSQRPGQVVVVNLPAVQAAPQILALSPEAQRLVADMVLAFNGALASQLAVLPVTFVDLYSFDIDFNQNFEKYGFKSITEPACKTNLLPGGASLFCTRLTLKSADAPEIYKFADGLHPATGYSRLVGQYVLTKMTR